jgi:hypothetical protein
LERLLYRSHPTDGKLARNLTEPFDVAWAQESQQPGSENLITRLRSADPLIRRNARVDLSEQGTQGFDTIARLLSESDYRLQIGAAAALAAMPDDARRQMPPVIRQRLTELRSHPDRTMQATADRALR